MEINFNLNSKNIQEKTFIDLKDVKEKFEEKSNFDSIKTYIENIEDTTVDEQIYNLLKKLYLEIILEFENDDVNDVANLKLNEIESKKIQISNQRSWFYLFFLFFLNQQYGNCIFHNHYYENKEVIPIEYIKQIKGDGNCFFHAYSYAKTVRFDKQDNKYDNDDVKMNSDDISKNRKTIFNKVNELIQDKNPEQYKALKEIIKVDYKNGLDEKFKNIKGDIVYMDDLTINIFMAYIDNDETNFIIFDFVNNLVVIKRILDPFTEKPRGFLDNNFSIGKNPNYIVLIRENTSHFNTIRRYHYKKQFKFNDNIINFLNTPDEDGQLKSSFPIYPTNEYYNSEGRDNKTYFFNFCLKEIFECFKNTHTNTPHHTTPLNNNNHHTNHHTTHHNTPTKKNTTKKNKPKHKKNTIKNIPPNNRNLFKVLDPFKSKNISYNPSHSLPPPPTGVVVNPTSSSPSPSLPPTPPPTEEYSNHSSHSPHSPPKNLPLIATGNTGNNENIGKNENIVVSSEEDIRNIFMNNRIEGDDFIYGDKITKFDNKTIDEILNDNNKRDKFFKDYFKKIRFWYLIHDYKSFNSKKNKDKKDLKKFYYYKYINLLPDLQPYTYAEFSIIYDEIYRKNFTLFERILIKKIKNKEINFLLFTGESAFPNNKNQDVIINDRGTMEATTISKLRD